MGTEKKNRVQREDKESVGSVDNGSGNNADAAASLAARRAKLRGALGGRSAYSADPFSTPPAAAFPDDYSNDPSGYQTDPNGYQPGYQDPATAYQQDTNGYQEPAYQEPSGYQNQSTYQQDQSGYQPDPSAYQDPSSYQEDSSAFPAAPAAAAQQDPAVNVYGVPVEQAPEPAPPDLPPASRPPRTRRATAQHQIVEPSPAPQATEPEQVKPPAEAEVEQAPAPVQAAPVFEAAPTPAPGASMANIAPIVVSPIQDGTVELINSIDQSLNACATNLAALQNLAGEQTDVLKGLSSTLQNQTLLEIGLNLNSLTESLTAALEPMKAIGELVPALDALVTALETKEQDQSEKLSPDTLVTSLADQLSAGVIDPWTFKCAYMAVYPTDHPADLLHRLVELLGTQRLSGDLFRAAYEAVQAAEPPPRTFTTPTAGGDYTRSISDEAIKAQLESLERSNRELQQRQDERERELSEILSQKEAELQMAQAQLNDKLEEINNRYADAADMIASREEEFRAALESKEMDIVEKDAELNMLRAQMEELRSQTEEMVKDLQKEMYKMKEEREQQQPPAPQESSAKPNSPNSQGFFDPTPNQSAGQRADIFEAAPAGNKPIFDAGRSAGGGAFGDNFNQQQQPSSENFGVDSGGYPAVQAQQQQAQPQYNQNASSFQAPQAQPAFQAPQPQQQAFQAPQQQQQAPQQQRPPAPAAGGPTTQPFTGGQSGSYGMGVRQQVFEVIVRQALAGAPWREICAGPMQVNNISPDEVEAEVKRRQSMLNK